jgi:hypothetical protein
MCRCFTYILRAYRIGQHLLCKYETPFIIIPAIILFHRVCDFCQVMPLSTNKCANAFVKKKYVQRSLPRHSQPRHFVIFISSLFSIINQMFRALEFCQTCLHNIMLDTHVTNFPNASKGGYKLFAFQLPKFL